MYQCNYTSFTSCAELGVLMLYSMRPVRSIIYSMNETVLCDFMSSVKRKMLTTNTQCYQYTVSTYKLCETRVVV